MASPRFEDRAEHARAVIKAVLEAVEPEMLVGRALEADLAPEGGIVVISAGKAAPGLAAGAMRGLGAGRGRVHRCVSALPAGTAPPAGLTGVEWFEVDHPLPSERNVRFAAAVESLVREWAGEFGQGEDRLVLALLSGGASAHLTAPASGLRLEDLADLTRLLLRAGATIDELNCVRKHCERLKGGRLARLAAPARVRCLVLSDVISDRLDVIASGPFAPDPTTYADALSILDRYRLMDAAPAIATLLSEGAAGRHEETPKNGDAVFEAVQTTILANNGTAVQAAAAAVQQLGFPVQSTQQGVEGEARQVGEAFARQLRSLAASRRPGAIIWGGETTVTVRGDGRGGRNQELALAAAVGLEGVRDVAVLTFATDGVDGPTDAAGALVTGQTAAAARGMGLDPAAALARNDSYGVLERAGSLIRTGPTGTNVCDVAVGLVY